MPKAKLTQKEMTDSEQRELKTLLDRAKKSHGRTLTNAETNRIKDDFGARLAAERAAVAKQARAAKKKKQAIKPDISATYQWSTEMHSRGKR